jgi:predicted nuclease of predicted toxin-antitoxin system
MKLLFDENLSPKLPGLLADWFPGASHVRDCGLKGAPDERIWDYARDHGYAIVTKDSDFHQRSLLWGAPPKVVWICLGNCSRDELVALLTAHRAAIAGLDQAATESTLVIFPTGNPP